MFWDSELQILFNSWGFLDFLPHLSWKKKEEKDMTFWTLSNPSNRAHKSDPRGTLLLKPSTPSQENPDPEAKNDEKEGLSVTLIHHGC